LVTIQVNPSGPVAELDSWFAESFNSAYKFDPGYVYDALGRNTFIHVSDAPANNAGISLAYNLVDQVTGITQSGSTTSFTYDALGRRVNETAGGLTTVRHYGDSSDNPEWTTQLSGANLTTDVYTGSLGSGLAVTTTFKGTVSTASMQLTNLRGHVVTTLDLDSNSVSGWSVYDSFGNPQTSQTNDNLINYSTYGQQERATNTTGLILMGARVYNPETNQFTSKDPIKGGNENSYTYPNDPINGSDFSGRNDALDLGVFIVGGLFAAAICLGTGLLGCMIAGLLAGSFGGFLSGAAKATEQKLKGVSYWKTVGRQVLIGGLTGMTGGLAGSTVKLGLQYRGMFKVHASMTRKDFRQEMIVGYGLDVAGNQGFERLFPEKKKK
jgi:RHS repeat-associated protein